MGKESDKTQAQIQREARRAERAEVRRQRSEKIRSAMEAHRSFMKEFAEAGGDLEKMSHPLATSMASSNSTDELKSSINQFYSSLPEPESSDE